MALFLFHLMGNDLEILIWEIVLLVRIYYISEWGEFFICIFIRGHSMLIRVYVKKKPIVQMYISFSIEHVYIRGDFLHWIHVLVGVCIYLFLPKIYLVMPMFSSENVSHLFYSYEKGEQPFPRVSGFLPYSSFHPFLIWLFFMLWCGLTITCFPLSSFHCFVSFYRIWFLSFLILLDAWLRFNIHALFLLILLIFDVSLLYYQCFHMDILRSMIHKAFYVLHLMHEEYGDYII